MKALVLLSGGLDSTVVAKMLLDRGELVACLMVDYGQPHARWELPRAVDFCAKYGIRALHAQIPIPGMDAMRIGSGAAGARVVPGRNLLLTSVAVSHALTVGADTVALGCNADDNRDYPDCRASFLTALNATTRAYGVQVVAPLMGYTKRQVVSEAARVGVDLDETWSCYEPVGPAPCGTCNACRLRDAAMEGR